MIEKQEFTKEKLAKMKKFSPLLGEPAAGVVNDLIAEVERLQDLNESLEKVNGMTLQQVKEKYFPNHDIDQLRGIKPMEGPAND